MKFQSYRIVFFITVGVLLIETSRCENESQNYNIHKLALGLTEKIRTLKVLESYFHNLENTNFLRTGRINSDLYFSILNDFKNVSNDSCSRDFMYVVDSIRKTDISNNWALEMLDSYGKLESSILEGNLNWLGDFNECRSVYAPQNNFSNAGNFHGKYCSLKVSLFNESLPISLGVCLPDTCDPLVLLKDYYKFINFTQKFPFINEINSTLEVTSLTCKANSRKLTNAAVATICILSIFLFLAFVGSFITAFKYIRQLQRHKNYVKDDEAPIDINSVAQIHDDFDDVLLLSEGSQTKLSIFIEGCTSFFNCFCVFTNGAKLLNTSATEGQLLCLHGIRFLSMSWVIVCHTYAFSFNAVKNLRSVLDLFDAWPFQVILNGFFSVDSFFVLSGFLMCFLYLQEQAKRKSSIPWLSFYVHRYLRLTPVYMLVIGFYTALFTYFGSGPFWPDYNIEPTCQKNWWWNLLYINNFQNMTDQCMAWSWYLANDMQFFVISPLFLITLSRWPRVGYFILALFFCGTWTASFLISYHYKMFTGLGDITKYTGQEDFMIKWSDYFEKLYIKPYTRIGPYLVGIVLGYILFKRKLNLDSSTYFTEKPRNYVSLSIGWTVASVVGLTCVYGLYHNNPGLVASSFYNSLSRSAFAICLSWVIFVCLTGQGGPVNKILSHKVFIPLSRLTYSAYLVHPMIIIGYFGAMKDTFEFSHSLLVISFLGLLLVTYAISLLVSLILESPIIRLEKIIRSKFQT